MSLAKAHLDDNAREILHHNWSLHVAQRGNCFLSTSKRKIKLFQFVFFLKRIRKFDPVSEILIPKLLQLFLDIEFRSQIYSGV